jgi:serine/threonine-protein kinase HipA
MPPRTIAVYYEGFAIGEIVVEDSGTTRFHYDPRWLATKGSFPISVTMPLGKAEYRHDTVLPWLANLLPEEQQLIVLSRALGVASSDTLTILKEIGGDTAGAFSFGEPSRRVDWSYDLLTAHYGEPSEQEALERHFKDLKKRPFLVGEDGVRLSLAGGQEKTALAVLTAQGSPKIALPEAGDQLAIPKSGAPSTLIIKPDNPALPGIVENEAYCLTLAGMIGLSVVDAGIIQAGERSALAVVRYDRKIRADGALRRLHQEDFAQANSLYPAQKYERGTLPGLGMTDLLKTGRYLSPEDALKLLDQVIFNILVANTDAHAKNYSMLFATEPTMAPLYDVSSVLFWDHVNQYHAQNLAGRKRKPGDMARRHWDGIAQDAGLGTRGVRLRVQEMIDAMVAHRVEATEAVAKQPGASADMVEHLAQMIERNALRIAGRLNASG